MLPPLMSLSVCANDFEPALAEQPLDHGERVVLEMLVTIVSKLVFASIVGMYENSLIQMPSSCEAPATSATNVCGLLEVVEHRDARDHPGLALSG